MYRLVGVPEPRLVAAWRLLRHVVDRIARWLLVGLLPGHLKTDLLRVCWPVRGLPKCGLILIRPDHGP